MIGLTIVAILLGLAAPAYSTYMQNTHIRNAAEGLQNGLSLARAEAVRRNTPVQFVLGSGAAWTVGCTTQPVDTPEDCPSTIASRSDKEGSSKASVATLEIVMPGGAAAASPEFTTTLIFNGLGAEVTLPPANNAVFSVTNPTGGACATDAPPGKMRCLQVRVTAGGQIRMCDPALTVTKPSDPQAC